MPVADQGEKIPLDGDPAVRLARGVLGRVRERTSRIGVEVLVEVAQIHRRLPVEKLSLEIIAIGPQKSSIFAIGESGEKVRKYQHFSH